MLIQLRRPKYVFLFVVWLVLYMPLASWAGETSDRWDWAFLSMVNRTPAPEIFTRAGYAHVISQGGRISIEFIDPQTVKGTDSPIFVGRIDSSGIINGYVEGFDFDFDREPMQGEYREKAFDDGCVSYEVLMKDVVPRRRVIILTREVCLTD